MDPLRVELSQDSKAELGESVYWDHARKVAVWVDIPAGVLHLTDPHGADSRGEDPHGASRGASHLFSFPPPLGCCAACDDGRILLALGTGFALFDPKDESLEPYSRLTIGAQHEAPGTRINDGTPDPKGRLWFGTMALEDSAAKPIGALYCLDTDGRIHLFRRGLHVPNGLAFSPDGRLMYLADTTAAIQTIWVYDYDMDAGRPENPRVFVQTFGLAGRPDGGTIDRAGCYWMAAVGGWQVVRFTPQGQVDTKIALPVEKPTKVAFGGENWTDIYVTSIGQQRCSKGTHERQPHAGGLWRISGHGIQGVAALTVKTPSAPSSA